MFIFQACQCPGNFLRTVYWQILGGLWQTEGNSFGDISGAPSGVTQALEGILFYFMVGERNNLEQRVFIYGCCYMKTKSCRRKLHCKFLKTCQSGDTISKLARKVKIHGIWSGKRQLKINHVLIEEKLDVCRKLEILENLCGDLTQQRGISVSSVWTATKLLHICPYKITVVPKIKPMDYGEWVRFCNWFINHVSDGLSDPKLTVFTDVANFNILGKLTHKTTGTVMKILMS
jgi:hypothetical protein